MIPEVIDSKRRCLQDHLNSLIEEFEKETGTAVLLTKNGPNRIKIGLHMEM